MATFIITAPAAEQLDCKGESLGMGDKRAVFFSPKIGKRKMYRQSMDSPQKGLKLLSFTNKEKAEQLCKSINEDTNDNFEVETQN